MNDGNRTVFRPSPLQGLKGTPPSPPPPPASGGFAPASPPFSGPPSSPPPSPSYASRALAADRDDVPLPARAQSQRNEILAEAAPILALAASLKSGRAREPLSSFHGQASEVVARFDRAMSARFTPETRQRAVYALCATLDDIAQNLPGVGAEASEWARRSLTVQTFRESIGGDRFWQIADEMLARPAGQENLIELFHACLAAGFEGRFRVMPDGKRRLHEIMTRLYAALEHSRGLSDRELVPHWRGVTLAPRKIGGLSATLLAAAIAAAVLLVAFIGFQLLLHSSAGPTYDALAKLNPSDPLTLTHGGGLPAAPSNQVAELEKFLAPEIAAHQVEVKNSAATVRVRTTIGQLFRPGSDQLEPGQEQLFRKIAQAVDKQPGPVTIEGHADSDRPTGAAALSFPDNNALSAARAETVRKLMAQSLTDPARLTAKGFGDTVPLASNDTPRGKSQNRRVEIVLQRHD